MLKIASALLFSVLAGSAGAQTFLTATLTNASENPPTVPTTAGGQPRPASFGTASFFINSAATFMTFTATIFNIDVNGLQTPNDVNDNLLNAHIHAGPTVTPTVNGPVVWGFFGMPFNDNAPSDATFTPFVTTPCFPSYPSNHASGSNAAIEILRRFYGSAGHAITLAATIPGLGLVTREYTALQQISKDIDDARVYGGIHFRFDQVAGEDVGRAVASYVYAHNLLRAKASDQ